MKGQDAVFSLRLPRQEADRLTQVARMRGITVSAAARAAIARGLSLRQGTHLTYGVTSGATLQISIIGLTVSDVRTQGGLAIEWPL